MFENLLKTITSLERRADDVGLLFKKAALAAAYDDMIGFAAAGIRNHPEVLREPDLYRFLILHFQRYYKQHINVAAGDIFNKDFIGDISTLHEWQEHGYQTLRNDANYQKRLRQWRRIYRGIGKVSYEEVIARRNAGFPTVLRLPYWMVFNYGSNAFGRDGFPSYPGAFFVEKGRAGISMRLKEAELGFDTLYADRLRREQPLSADITGRLILTFGGGKFINIPKAAGAL